MKQIFSTAQVNTFVAQWQKGRGPSSRVPLVNNELRQQQKVPGVKSVKQTKQSKQNYMRYQNKSSTKNIFNSFQKLTVITLHAKLSRAVYCYRSCLCVCNGQASGRAVSEPYYSQHACSVCVSGELFSLTDFNFLARLFYNKRQTDSQKLNPGQ